MLLHPEYADVTHVGVNALIPVKLRLKPAPALTLDGLRRSFTGVLSQWFVK
jgi:hypothetical protein